MDEQKQPAARVLSDDSSERRHRVYETLISNAGDFVYAFGLDHRIVFANEALLAMWGLRVDQVVGRTLLEVGYDPAHADRHNREIDRVKATRLPIRGEAAFTGTQGTRQYEYIFVPIIGANGEVELVSGTTRDVTARHRAQIRQAFQARLAEHLRPLADPVEVKAEASKLLGQHLHANRVVYFEIQGGEYVINRDYTAGVEPLAGRYPVATFGASLLAQLVQGNTVVESDATTEPTRPQAEREGFASIQVRGHVDVPLVKGGRFVAGMTVHVSAVREWERDEIELIEDTAERTWAAAERVRAQIDLQQSEDRFQFVRRSSGVGFWYCDLPFDVLEWDELVKEHFFLPPDAVVTIETFYDRIHPQDREATREAISLSISQRTPYDVYYRTVSADNGDIKWVRAIGRTFYALDGTPIRFDGVTLDVTREKQSEAMLLEADRRKDEFIAMLAHELRNPLAPISNGLQVMRVVDDRGEVEKVRLMMERQLLHMRRLVDDLLDVSRLTTGKLSLQEEVLALQDIVSNAVETSRPIIEQQGHTLLVTLPDDDVLVHGDRVRLAQVVSNLLTNSAKYTPPGGQIRLSLALIDGAATINVADDGIGIPSNMLGCVFQMFTQIDRSLERTSGGLGVGLALVKRFVELHGGTVRAYSAGEGQGSDFTVRLPALLALPSTPPLDPLQLPEHGQHAVRRILVVDDNIDAADSLAQLLEASGHAVRTTYDGLAGLKVAEEFGPDLILCDIGMPGLNGYDFARQIKSETWGAPAVLIALTGYGQDDDIARSADAGFAHHLIKPINLDVLMALITRV